MHAHRAKFCGGPVLLTVKNYQAQHAACPFFSASVRSFDATPALALPLPCPHARDEAWTSKDEVYGFER